MMRDRVSTPAQTGMHGCKVHCTLLHAKASSLHHACNAIMSHFNTKHNSTADPHVAAAIACQWPRCHVSQPSERRQACNNARRLPAEGTYVSSRCADSDACCALEGRAWLLPVWLRPPVVLALLLEAAGGKSSASSLATADWRRERKWRSHKTGCMRAWRKMRACSGRAIRRNKTPYSKMQCDEMTCTVMKFEATECK